MRIICMGMVKELRNTMGKKKGNKEIGREKKIRLEFKLKLI